MSVSLFLSCRCVHLCHILKKIMNWPQEEQFQGTTQRVEPGFGARLTGVYPRAVPEIRQAVHGSEFQFPLCHIKNHTYSTGLMYKSHNTWHLRCSWHRERLSNMYVPLWEVGKAHHCGNIPREAGKAGDEMNGGGVWRDWDWAKGPVRWRWGVSLVRDQGLQWRMAHLHQQESGSQEPGECHVF